MQLSSTRKTTNFTRFLILKDRKLGLEGSHYILGDLGIGQRKISWIEKREGSYFSL